MSVGEDVARKAEEVLAEIPLCDRCLGRLFALLGYGWSNKDRGDAIKRVVVMNVHRRIRLSGKPTNRDLRILENIGEQALPLLRLLASRIDTSNSLKEQEPRCAICGGKLDDVIRHAAVEGARLLRVFDIHRFVVGAIVDATIKELEDNIKLKYGLAFGEEIKAEIRREVGKLIQAMDNTLTVDFDEPEATLLVYYPAGNVDIQVNSLLLNARYWKLGRLISQAYWPSPEGPRYFSVEQAAWGLLSATGGERLVIHAAGREDVDARMLGTGRPTIIEIKAPRRRHLSINEFEKHANSSSKGLVEFKIYNIARRRQIRLYKEESVKLKKTYKALIVPLTEAITEDDLRKIETEFTNRTILQRTPKRVLHRRPDITRSRTVYKVSCRRLTRLAAECLIHADGGLYIKELVSGDDGRTKPSFSEVASKPLRCIELDVISVESPIEPPY